MDRAVTFEIAGLENILATWRTSVLDPRKYRRFSKQVALEGVFWAFRDRFDQRQSHRIALRAIQADYFLTLLPNGTSDRQNNLRLSAGIVFRFGNK